MTMWTPSRDRLGRPYFLSIADQVAHAVSTGVLKSGEQLPPQRQLAYKLGVSLPTVSRAYEELVRRGLASGETGRGTFIKTASASPEAITPFMPERTPGLVDLSILKPVSDAVHLEKMKSALALLSENLPPSAIFGSRPSAMFARHRAIGIEWLKLCGVETDARTVHLTNGGTPALTVAFMAVCQPGMTIATEATGLHVMLPLASYLGLKVHGVDIDENGIIPDALEHACQLGVIRALFMLPNALAPTAFIMNEERRLAIVDIARKYDLQIIEDDALGPLLEERPVTFHELAPERTIYITSFTKPVMSGLRTGYLVAPERLLPAVENRQIVTTWTATPLIAEIAARWVEDGTSFELVEWQRGALRRRHEIVQEALKERSFMSSPGSLHCWLPLGDRFPEEEFVSHARKQGVALARGSLFAISENRAAVRVSLGSSTEEELRRGLSVITNLLESEPEPFLY
ncbi:PLP-dependent aminotransferase family protein [Ensifer sp. IC4062]|nr:PLP-dependent aminotransferase family protein [Ensifer sp. IC4062]MCA1444674.1 PLP-dependent aminotransferase family protein [Ensifer sp. IC4062]